MLLKSVCGGVNKVPITLDLLKGANDSLRVYMEHLRQEMQRKDRKRLKNQNKKHTKGNWMK